MTAWNPPDVGNGTLYRLFSYANQWLSGSMGSSSAGYCRAFRPRPPTLVVHGERDGVVPVEHSREFLKTLAELSEEGEKIDGKKFPGRGFPSKEVNLDSHTNLEEGILILALDSLKWCSAVGSFPTFVKDE